MRLLRNVSTSTVRVWQRYERHISLGAVFGGFAFDLFFITGPDNIIDNLLLLAYLLLAAIIIVLLNVRSRAQMDRKSRTEPLILLFVLQFCFGALASNLLILYGKSGTWGSSALFIGLLVAFIFSNEFLKNRYAQLRLNIAVYYFLVLTYITIALPTFVLHSIGMQAFVISGLVSVIIIAAFLAVIFVFVFKRKEQRRMWEVSALVGIIFMVFNGLYFLNIIPPVPLALKDIGVYHTLVRDGTNYAATYEAPAWYVFWRDTSATYTAVPGKYAYCFSAVYAPGALSASVVHRWEQYDAVAKEWKPRSVVSFPINGGREGGYRGWSNKAGLTAGKWRCNVETTRGQLIGRITFDVVEAQTLPALSTTTL